MDRVREFYDRSDIFFGGAEIGLAAERKVKYDKKVITTPDSRRAQNV